MTRMALESTHESTGTERKLRFCIALCIARSTEIAGIGDYVLGALNAHIVDKCGTVIAAIATGATGLSAMYLGFIQRLLQAGQEPLVIVICISRRPF
jgi:hypothetical protein